MAQDKKASVTEGARCFTYHNARRFIYRNARPLDLARWKYHFENGRKEDVVECLKAYQNADGGFGHGLEADNLNPHSIPMQVWKASVVIEEIGGLHKTDPMIQSMLHYLENTEEFDGESWSYVTASNNDYPHASWWHYPHPDWYQECGAELFNRKYNPTASLAGFILFYAERDSALYARARKIARRAIDDLETHQVEADMHVLPCYVQMYQYITKAELGETFEAEHLRGLLDKLVAGLICKDLVTSGTGYVCRPSYFFQTRDSAFYAANREAAQNECEFIRKSQLPDGSYAVPWNWGGYPEEWAVSKNWWKASITVDNMIFLKNMEEC